MIDILIVIILVISLLAGGISIYRTWKAKRRWKKLLNGLTTLFWVGVIAVNMVLLWYYNRPRPEDTRRMLFKGVEYIRDVRDEPRPVIVHVVKIDLDAPGLEFLVTPATVPGEKGMFRARTTSTFLDEYDLQLAINGDFFDLWYDNGPWPEDLPVGYPVNTRGLSVSQGIVGSRGFVNPYAYTTLYLSPTNDASFLPPSDGAIYNAISGSLMVVQNGQPNRSPRGGSYVRNPNPRTAFALDRTGRQLIIVAVDGRQPNYSEGLTIAELGEVIIEYGGYVAQNLDGGGSVALVIEGEDGEQVVLNTPIDSRIPGRQRLVANHLGIYALPLDDS